MKSYSLILLSLTYGLLSPVAFADSGLVKFINDSQETFTLSASSLPAATSIGLPTTIPNHSDKNILITLTESDAGKHVQYDSIDGKLHFTLSVNQSQYYVFHHTTKKTISYLSVDWGNVMDQTDIHYVLPLFWKDDYYKTLQPVRVDSDNNAIIGIFEKEPNNVMTIMSYNTDKDGTGTDHDPSYHSITDILDLFANQRLPTPDVLMIQEGLGAQDLSAFKNTLSQLSPGEWFSNSATEGDRPDTNIIFVNPKYGAKSIRPGEIVFKDQCGWGLIGKRNAVFVDIPVSSITSTTTPGYFRIFNAHLESGSGSDIFFHAAQVRFSQFSEILNYPRTNVLGIAVGGDFNTMPILDDTTGLTHDQFDSLVSVFDKYLGDPNVNWGTPITCTWSTCKTVTFNIGLWTDRLYNTPLTLAGYKTDVLYPVVAHQVDGYSDHLPIWVTLYFERNAF